MEFAEYGPWGCWACVPCDRVWMPGPYVRNVLRLTAGAPLHSDILRNAAAHPAHDDLVCPACERASFGTFAAEAATIDACTGCGGIHFPPGQYQSAFPGSQRVLGGGALTDGQVAAALTLDAAAAILIALLS